MRYLIFLSLLPLLLTGCTKAQGPATMANNIVKNTSYQTSSIVEQKFIKSSFIEFTKAWWSFSYNPEGASYKPVDSVLQATVNPYDPTANVAKKIKRHLAQAFNIREVKQSSDYHISFTNGGWGLKYIALLDEYNIFYTAIMNITNLKAPSTKSQTRSQTFSCRYMTEELYADEEIFANKAGLVKTVMEKASIECANQLIKHIDMAGKGA